MATTERRVQRSDTPEVAIDLFLRALVERHDLDAVSLVDDHGALVAGVARAGCVDLDLAWIGEVASVCALGTARAAPLAKLVERATQGRSLAARSLMLRGERLCIAAVGGALPPERALVAGIERILARALVAAA